MYSCGPTKVNAYYAYYRSGHRDGNSAETGGAGFLNLELGLVLHNFAEPSAERVPLGGDLPPRREETHRALARNVVLPELGQRAVHAAEGEGLAGDRHPDVDPDHPGAEAAREPLRRTTRGGVHARGVAVRACVLDAERLLLGCHDEHGDDGPEYLVVQRLVRRIGVPVVRWAGERASG